MGRRGVNRELVKTEIKALFISKFSQMIYKKLSNDLQKPAVCSTKIGNLFKKASYIN